MPKVCGLLSEQIVTQSDVRHIIFRAGTQVLLAFNIVSVRFIKHKTFAKRFQIIFNRMHGYVVSAWFQRVRYFCRRTRVAYVVKHKSYNIFKHCRIRNLFPCNNVFQHDWWVYSVQIWVNILAAGKFKRVRKRTLCQVVSVLSWKIAFSLDRDVFFERQRKHFYLNVSARKQCRQLSRKQHCVWACYI